MKTESNSEAQSIKTKHNLFKMVPGQYQVDYSQDKNLSQVSNTEFQQVSTPVNNEGGFQLHQEEPLWTQLMNR